MRNRGLQTLNFISTRFKIGNPGIFYDSYSFRFTPRCSGASTRKRTVPPPPPRVQFLSQHSPSINSVNLKKAGMAIRNSPLFWSAKSRSLTDYRKVDQNNVYCFSYCFFQSFFFLFFSIFRLAMGEGGGGGCAEVPPRRVYIFLASGQYKRDPTVYDEQRISSSRFF